MLETASHTSAPLSAHDLLAGSTIVHSVEVPDAVLHPGAGEADGAPGCVSLRPLTIGTLVTISRAARDDRSLIPLLVIKEALVEPALGLDAIRRLHVGLVHHLVSRINEISGLTADGEPVDDVLGTPAARTHVLLARHFGWTPEQVAQLTPGQVGVYLAGIERLLAMEPAGA